MSIEHDSSSEGKFAVPTVPNPFPGVDLGGGSPYRQGSGVHVPGRSTVPVNVEPIRPGAESRQLPGAVVTEPIADVIARQEFTRRLVTADQIRTTARNVLALFRTYGQTEESETLQRTLAELTEMSTGTGLEQIKSFVQHEQIQTVLMELNTRITQVENSLRYFGVQLNGDGIDYLKVLLGRSEGKGYTNEYLHALHAYAEQLIDLSQAIIDNPQAQGVTPIITAQTRLLDLLNRNGYRYSRHHPGNGQNTNDRTIALSVEMIETAASDLRTLLEGQPEMVVLTQGERQAESLLRQGYFVADQARSRIEQFAQYREMDHDGMSPAEQVFCIRLGDLYDSLTLLSDQRNSRYEQTRGLTSVYQGMESDMVLLREHIETVRILLGSSFPGGGEMQFPIDPNEVIFTG